MKFINQTNNIIKKQNTNRQKKRNKSAIPGVSRFVLDTNSTILQPARKDKQQDGEQRNINNITGFQKNTYPTTLFTEFSDTSFLQEELTHFITQSEQALNLSDVHSLNFNGPLMNLSHDWMDELIQNNDISLEDAHLESQSTQNEFRLVCHYCRIMIRFYSVKDADWNFYSFVNEALAYRYKPLKYSILAWSALHLSIMEDSSLDVANKYYDLALKSLMGQDFLNSEIPLEILLTGSYFLCLFDIMAGKSHTLKILSHVYQSVKIGTLFNRQLNNKDTKNSLSSFSFQIINWLIYLDIRSSLFSGNIQFPNHIMVEAEKATKTKNSDFQYLFNSDVYEKKVVLTIFDNSRNVLKTSFGLQYPNESEETDRLQDSILKLMMKNMLMFGTVIRLKNWLDHCGNSIEFNPRTLESKIHDLYLSNRSLESLNANDKVSQFHILIEMTLIHAVIIYFDRVCYPDIRTNEKCQKSAEEIFQIAVKLKNLRYQGTPGSTQWPFPLIIAGIETTNVIYQNWIVRELEDCEKECWGINITKSKELIKEVIRRQNESKLSRIDVGEVMDEITGFFII